MGITEPPAIMDIPCSIVSSTPLMLNYKLVTLLVLILISLVSVATVWILETEDLDDFTHWKGTEKKNPEKTKKRA